MITQCRTMTDWNKWSEAGYAPDTFYTITLQSIKNQNDLLIQTRYESQIVICNLTLKNYELLQSFILLIQMFTAMLYIRYELPRPIEMAITLFPLTYDCNFLFHVFYKI